MSGLGFLILRPGAVGVLFLFTKLVRRVVLTCVSADENLCGFNRF